MSQREEGGAPASSFHRLTVKAVREETADARSFILTPEAGARALFRYQPGQFLTFRLPLEHGAIKRSYSLSSAPVADPDMTICVKRLAGGRGSTWFHDHLPAGARIDAAPPAGRFVLCPGDAPLLLVAGGSGITPCLSLIKQALMATTRRVRLLYINRSFDCIIYRDVIKMLEERFANRFDARYWLDDQKGLIARRDILDAVIGWAGADSYICGPTPLMDMAEAALLDHFGPTALILTERFVSPDDSTPDSLPSRASTLAEAAGIGTFRLTLDGEERVVPIKVGQTVLDAALLAGIDAPHVCVEGHCGTCMALLREGDVSMASTKALSKRNFKQGRILACQAKPATSAPLWIDFDF